MNPKHLHTPISTRLRCPICHQAVYSRGGIHPQCAMRQSEPPLPKPEESTHPLAGAPEVVGIGAAVVAAAEIAPAMTASPHKPVMKVGAAAKARGARTPV
jgi:hypothetical protein